jgi:hypothetical protein
MKNQYKGIIIFHNSFTWKSQLFYNEATNSNFYNLTNASYMHYDCS